MAPSATPELPAVPVDAAVAAAAAVLARGGTVALPTETVYGLAAVAADEPAVAAVFAAKGRPAHNPLIVHGADPNQLTAVADLTPAVPLLALWPGPLTLVLRRRPGAPLASAATAGLDTVAVRVPAAPVMAGAAAAMGPLVAPSANRSGRVSATSAAAVAAELTGRIDLIVDGGPSPIGVESTVIDLSGPPTLLRPGAIERARIEALIGPLAERSAGAPLASPGLLASHYAPRAAVRLDVAAADVERHEGWLALGREDSAAAHTVRLSERGDLAEAAANLYAGLRALDGVGVPSIAVSPIPSEGIGHAIRDRLRRAAAPRPADPSARP